MCEVTNPRAICCACKEKIIGIHLIIQGLGFFHPMHFTCQYTPIDKKGEICGKVLGITTFTERENVLYCNSCYSEKWDSRCAFCDEIIKEKCINALGKSFHSDHFFCSQCGNPFVTDDDGKLYFMEFNGQAYCEEDYHALYANVCAGCNTAIKGIRIGYVI